MNIKKVLITAGRTFSGLDLARGFHKLGIEVYSCDPNYHHLCRYSNSVKKSFCVTSPRKNPDQFIDQVVSIVKEYKIDLIVPVLEETLYLSKNREKFPAIVQIFCDSFKKLLYLHNKYYFCRLLERYQILTPFTELISSKEELDKISLPYPFFIKASYSRASQGAWKISSKEDLSKISFIENNPLIAQELITGKKYCTYSVCQKGKVCSHTTYPVQYTILESSCVSFEAIDHPKILTWIKKLVSELEYTGQIAFDFIEREDGNLYCIECNPRATSGIHLLANEEGFMQTFLKSTDQTITPTVGRAKKLGPGMIMYGWKCCPFKEFCKELVHARDVIFSFKDIKPFLIQPFLFISIVYHALKHKKNFSQIFTYDFDFNTHEEDDS